MNKLRKSPPASLRPFNVGLSGTSRTLQLAQDMSISLGPSSTPSKLFQPFPHQSQEAAPRPISPTARYWAARAISAETLLAVQETHQREPRPKESGTTAGEESGRVKEVFSVAEYYREKHASLEKLVLILLLFLFSLVVAIIYLATQHTRQSAKKSQPYHFTIPILSPFTSVVEHETSVIGSKTIALTVMALAALAYFYIRQRLL